MVTAGQAGAAGEPARLNDARPNGELLLATGAVQRDNRADYLELPASLVRTDRLYTAKMQVLEAVGMQARVPSLVVSPRGPPCHGAGLLA